MAVLALVLHLVCLLLVLIAGFVALKEFRKPYKERNQRKIDTLLVFVLIVALIAILSSVIIDL
ncbi:MULTISPECIES: hypothetical protein [Staphylococcus]|jgi:hypothetical protein|uniref:Uncharacterized protein n=1 Tax=Staphylococcus shinii TaxID=2912228 RepID=A0A418IBQ1_9STAP|nr:hypothetical protein [Staphylococcus shinii]MBO3064738.1 hypothetical protein [Staphylococcus shinii]MDW8563820.1 hypothetical protein [Staphylococcus shinii]MDW8567061.1 hypothetical protein [Staphylococcus shinii]MDW8569993.1 hypothetical protein [Staphylococcus shinii]MDW8574102.1 hypothetical protein [Staphylococcus shinii]